jgi:hypothetical protein
MMMMIILHHMHVCTHPKKCLATAMHSGKGFALINLRD